MIRKKIKWLIALAAAALTCTLVGCSVGRPDVSDEIKNGKYVATVTYYANRGEFSGSAVSKDMMYRDNTPVVNIGSTSVTKGDLTLTRAGYVFDGWEKVELDAESQPKFTDAGGNAVSLAYNDDGTPYLDNFNNQMYINSDGVRFSRDKVYPVSSGVKEEFNENIRSGEHWYLCAVWLEEIKIDIKLVCDSPVTGNDGLVYRTGDSIASKYFGTQQTVTLGTATPMSATDATFLKYYRDAECTQEILSTDRFEKPADGENLIVYAKYLAGSWTFVSKASDVSKMFSGIGRSSNAYYLLNDIDCSALGAIGLSDGMFACRIEGNGFTISNLKFESKNIGANATMSVFGAFADTAAISGLTIENVTVTASTRNAIRVSGIYAVSHAVSEKAKFEDFTIDGIELIVNIAEGATVENVDGSHNEYLIKGADGEEITVSGLTVTNSKLTKNDI